MKPHYISFLIYTACFVFFACSSQVPVQSIEEIPKLSEADKKYADVYKALDGVWQGKFYIFESKNGQDTGIAKPMHFPGPKIEDKGLSLKTIIEVKQEYVSETPYFQRVTIRDTYADNNGKKSVIKSLGVNKIQDGKMYCVVIKPNETIIHTGDTEGKDTIIWQRNISSPLKVEYFVETVKGNTYTIKGWGYYGKDNLKLTPRIWFYGKYVKKL